MKRAKIYLTYFLVMAVLQACNTLYNTKAIQIEILEPGKVKLPEGYSKIAFCYNNTNVAYNPLYATYFVTSKDYTDPGNLDSTASWIYYDYVLSNLRQQDYLDTVIELQASDFAHLNIDDSLAVPTELLKDSLDLNAENSGRIAAYVLSRYLKNNPPAWKDSAKVQTLDPLYGLYSAQDLEAIADSTQADMLLSLDHFSTLNSTFEANAKTNINEVVSVNAFWTAYDLRETKLLRYFLKSDTIGWSNFYSPGIDPFKLVPPRKDAVLNASDEAGTRFAEYLSPHWILVDRFYYRSGHVELKKTDKLVADGKWLDAAAIWKSEINNPNKSISAKCMFNLAVASEMLGNNTVALDWVVRSYHLFGELNEIHAENCKMYIRALAQRRIDSKMLDEFYFPE